LNPGVPATGAAVRLPVSEKLGGQIQSAIDRSKQPAAADVTPGT
jgi:hypothetical protein